MTPTNDDNPTPPPPGIVGIENPGTSKVQTLEAVNGSLAAGSTPFQKPSNLFQDLTNSNVLYVVDDGNFLGLNPGLIGQPAPEAAVLKVQFSSTSNPLVTIVSKEEYLVNPTGVVELNGQLYVTDTGNTASKLSLGYVIKIDPSSGMQTRLAGTVGQFKCPGDIALRYNSPNVPDTNYLWVADQGSNAANEPNIPPVGTIWKVDLTNNGNNRPIVFSYPFTM